MKVTAWIWNKNWRLKLFFPYNNDESVNENIVKKAGSVILSIFNRKNGKKNISYDSEDFRDISGVVYTFLKHLKEEKFKKILKEIRTFINDINSSDIPLVFEDGNEDLSKSQQSKFIEETKKDK